MSELNIRIAPEMAALLEQVAYQTPAAPPEPDSTSSSRLGLRLGQIANVPVFLGRHATRFTKIGTEISIGPSMEKRSILRWSFTVYLMLIRVDGSPGFAECKATE